MVDAVKVDVGDAFIASCLGAGSSTHARDKWLELLMRAGEDVEFRPSVDG